MPFFDGIDKRRGGMAKVPYPQTAEQEIVSTEIAVAVRTAPLLEAVAVAPVVSLVPSLVADVASSEPNWGEMAKGTDRGRYDEKEMLALLVRLNKGSTFMLEHLYDERGAAKMDEFLKVVEGVQNLLTAHRALKILSA